MFVLDFTKSCNSEVSVAIAEHDYGVLIFIFLFVVHDDAGKEGRHNKLHPEPDERKFS